MAANGDLGAGTTILGSYSGACPAPSNTVDCIPSEEDSHSIGTVRSAPDGTLYVGSGDAAAYGRVDPLALRTYDERSLAGKILHVDRNGRGLPGPRVLPDGHRPHQDLHQAAFQGLSQPVPLPVAARGRRAPRRRRRLGDVGGSRPDHAAGPVLGMAVLRGLVTDSRLQRLQRGAARSTRSRVVRRPTCRRPSSTPTVTSRVPATVAILPGPVYQGTAYASNYRGTALFGDYAKGVLRRLEFDGDTVVRATDFGTGWYGVDLEASRRATSSACSSATDRPAPATSRSSPHGRQSRAGRRGWAGSARGRPAPGDVRRSVVVGPGR